MRKKGGPQENCSGVSIRELRATIGLGRERLEEANAYVLPKPPLGQAVQRQRDELRLVTAPEIGSSVEWLVFRPSTPRSTEQSRA